jgi:hypothetical protein
MKYKTICLELLEQRPRLHDRLRQERKLLTAVDFLALGLKARHETWKEQLSRRWPGSDPQQISSETLELALKEMEDSLPPESPEEEDETLSLDAAMAYLRRHTPPA